MKVRLFFNVPIFLLLIFTACHNDRAGKIDSKAETPISKVTSKPSADLTSYVNTELRGPSVLIFDFHSTNRCVSCNAIEATAKKTIEDFYAKEKNEGRVKMMVYNVDDAENSEIAEKFQATGTALFLVKMANGKEAILDMTGDGFKYAKHNPEQLEEIIKNNVAEFLK